MANTSEEQSLTNVAGKSPKPDSRSGHKTISAFAIFALGLNAVAAVYTSSPSDFALPNVSRLAQLLPDLGLDLGFRLIDGDEQT